MGSADVVPGVSGGTVALVLGIYARLVDSIRAFTSALARLLRGRRNEAREASSHVEWALVVPLGLGIVTAVAVGLAVLPPLLEEYPTHMRALFLGLVVASLSVPWRRIDHVTPRHLGLAGGFAVVAFVVVGLPPVVIENPSLVRVLLSAAVAITAMVLPGISAAFLLTVMGIYQATLQAGRDLDVAYVAVFVLGATVGLGVFSRLIGSLLDRRHDTTMAALVGVMAGSLRALWPWQEVDRDLLLPALDASLLSTLGLAAAGFLTVRLFVRAEGRSEVGS